ncbi:MAG: Maf family protein [Firmicutes bacterium]|nr:Maf family protein [Bacillota bacterium]
MTDRIILASKSPRRLEILRQHGIEPIVKPVDADESLPEGIAMEEAVEYLALTKARACYEEVRDDDSYKDYIIIGSDTVVFKDEIMGKPEDRNDAYRMISAINDDCHYVSTGVATIRVSDGNEFVSSAVTRVYCKKLSEQDIQDYLDTDEPYDKAGAYAIQGLFGKHIDRIEGDYDNVVGLPYRIVQQLLKCY